MRQNGLIREAECAVDGIGGCPHLKPLQQRNVLRMVDKVEVLLLNLNGCGRVRQHLNRIAFFQVRLAYLCGGRHSGELPVWSGIADERIGVRFSQFMAQRGHVLESGAEESGRDPACELSDPAVLRKSSIQEERVEPKNAAAAGGVRISNVQVEQERVGK